ncbi:MAG: 2-C-methyl-D-erythritol 4-phosphate cytidylyltransferase [Bacteroidetes bacterium]|nr:2-C-methyl-D-erythritol 4-phosphate cytidylyltransferase [Bacteroidota bacterium]MBS1630409.1 2-C-methyl-D-erythritol 4-phosphate cytidylyltransferase [Bacteroidota bacterium]
MKPINDKQAWVVLVAGGSGSRMGSALPKQFLNLGGKPLLCHSIEAFHAALPGMHLILVLPAMQLSLAQMVLQALPGRIDLQLVAGGETRFASVANGLREVPDDALVLVHDGARPLISVALIQRCYEAALLQGSAVPVVPVTDSMREIQAESSRPLAREHLRIVQTPQAFDAAALKAAFTHPYEAGFTDEASVWELAGRQVHLVAGERSNIKITTPEDLILAEALLAARQVG